MSVRHRAETAAAARRARFNWKLVSLAIVAACIVLFVAANAHLVYVAIASQPDCVPHSEGYAARPVHSQAAKPAC